MRRFLNLTTSKSVPPPGSFQYGTHAPSEKLNHRGTNIYVLFGKKDPGADLRQLGSLRIRLEINPTARDQELWGDEPSGPRDS